MSRRVLIIGGGGREHAIIKALKRSPQQPKLFCSPGNAGIAADAVILESEQDTSSLVALAKREHVDLCIVGPEVPLVAGLVDALTEAGVRAFGPSQGAARLEGSKAVSKAFMKRRGIPTANHETFTDLDAALSYLETCLYPTVVKNSELAAGKGVTVAPTQEQAEAAVRTILPGGELVIEDFLEGQEVSYLLFSDGQSFAPLLLAQDYKQALDGDAGPMTGGMGTVCPAPLLTPEQQRFVETQIVEPTLAGLRAEGSPFKGVLFIGLMVTSRDVKVLEYNVRFGDPETQVVLPLLETDLLDVFDAVIDERLAKTELKWRAAATACVVMAAPGYPGSYPKDIPITLPDLPNQVEILHAGTKRLGEQLVSSGGRVLNIVAGADTLPEALKLAYETVAATDFPGAHFRRDIGGRLQQGS